MEVITEVKCKNTEQRKQWNENEYYIRAKHNNTMKSPISSAKMHTHAVEMSFDTQCFFYRRFWIMFWGKALL